MTDRREQISIVKNINSYTKKLLLYPTFTHRRCEGIPLDRQWRIRWHHGYNEDPAVAGRRSGVIMQLDHDYYKNRKSYAAHVLTHASSMRASAPTFRVLAVE